MEVAKENREEHRVCQPQRLEGIQSVRSGKEGDETHPEHTSKLSARSRTRLEERGVLEEEDEGYDHRDEKSRLLMGLNRQDQRRKYDCHHIDCKN
jgi:hypothetical protein